MVEKQYADWASNYHPEKGDYLVLSIQVDIAQHIDYEIKYSALVPEPESESFDKLLHSLSKIKLNLDYMEKASRYVNAKYPEASFQLIESGILIDGLTDEQIIECVKAEDIIFAVVVVS